MHDLACTLRPMPNGALTPSVGIGAPRFDRADPMPLLVPSHRDVITVLQSVAASASEVAVSRQLNGPALIDWITFTANTVNFVTLRMIGGITNDTNPSADALSVGEGLVDHTFGDTYTTNGILTGVGVSHTLPLSHRVHRQLFRLGFAFINASANAVVISAHVGVQYFNQVPRVDAAPAS